LTLQALGCLSAGLWPLLLQGLCLLLQHRQPHGDVYRILSINIIMECASLWKVDATEAAPEADLGLERLP
jgi:hypothetical protein